MPKHPRQCADVTSGSLARTAATDKSPQAAEKMRRLTQFFHHVNKNGFYNSMSGRIIRVADYTDIRILFLYMSHENIQSYII